MNINELINKIENTPEAEALLTQFFMNSRFWGIGRGDRNPVYMPIDKNHSLLYSLRYLVCSGRLTLIKITDVKVI